MKKLSVIALMICFFASLTPAFANHSDKRCPMSEHQCAYKHCEKKSHDKSSCPIASALMKKSCFFLTNADEIGLNEDQVKHIKMIGMEAQKQAILGKAQMKVAFIDITSKLHEEKVDVEGVNKMIDELSASMVASTKKSLQSYAELKSVLTAEQMAKAKKLWKKNK